MSERRTRREREEEERRLELERRRRIARARKRRQQVRRRKLMLAGTGLVLLIAGVTAVGFAIHGKIEAKKEKEAKKKQKVTVIKEIRCGITIEENDIAIKAKNARKFLVDGDKVKITIRFKGREAALSHLGVKILDNFVSKLEDVCVVEKPAKQDGRNMTMVLAPKKA